MSDIQQLDPTHDVTVESIISQEAPGKGSDAAAQSLVASLQSMSNEELLELVQAAYREDPNANSVVLEKAAALLNERGLDKEAKTALQEVKSEHYRELLGNYIGGKLFDAVSKETNIEALQGHGAKALDGALSGLVGQLDKLGLDSGGTEALTKLSGALQASAMEEANKFLATDKGKDVLSEISQWVEENPGWIVTAAILAAAGAIAADMKIPELKQKFKITDGLTAEVAAQLGSLRNIGLEAAKANLEYVRGNLKVTAGMEHNSEKGQKYDVAARYGTAENNVEASGHVNEDGQIKLNLGADFMKGPLSGKADAEHDFGLDQSKLGMSLRFGNDTDYTSLGSQFNLGAGGELTSSLSGKLRHQLFSDEKNNDQTWVEGGFDKQGDDVSTRFGTVRQMGAYTLGSSMISDKMGLQQKQNFSYKGDGFNMGIDTHDLGMDGGIDALSAEFGWKPHDMATAILKVGRDYDGTSHLAGKVDFNGKNELEGYEGMVEAGLNLDTGAIERISARLGFRDPKEFRGFAISYSQKVGSQDYTEHTLGAMFETTLGEYMVRGQGQAKFQNDDMTAGSAGIHAAKFLNPNLALIAGGRALYDQNLYGNDNMHYIPEAGVQYKNIPVTVGYDFGSEAVMVRLTIPFGR
jgi:hypothetical protein